MALKAFRFRNPANHEWTFRKPPYLKPGDLVALTSPAGSISLEEVQPAVRILESWGFTVKIGSTIGKKDFSFGGTDEERANDFQEQLNDPKVKAIMCARGGYGSVRIVDQINWEQLLQQPKWIIGFSDITVLHSHVHNNCKMATIHSKMCNSFPDDPTMAEPLQMDSVNSICKALRGELMSYDVNVDVKNKNGHGKGVIIGGNLKTIESLSGSSSDIKTAHKILFLEDTGEYLYSIDRMFWNLKRTGKLNELEGLILGGFSVKPDDPGEDFGRTVQEIVLEKVKAFKYPVCFGFPIGHQKINYALKCGIRHSLFVGENQVILKESL